MHPTDHMSIALVYPPRDMTTWPQHIQIKSHDTVVVGNMTDL
jgi:hypothetical protein